MHSGIKRQFDRFIARIHARSITLEKELKMMNIKLRFLDFRLDYYKKMVENTVGDDGIKNIEISGLNVDIERLSVDKGDPWHATYTCLIENLYAAPSTDHENSKLMRALASSYRRYNELYGKIYMGKLKMAHARAQLDSAYNLLRPFYGDFWLGARCMVDEMREFFSIMWARLKASDIREQT